jgi:hypothetical protein
MTHTTEVASKERSELEDFLLTACFFMRPFVTGDSMHTKVLCFNSALFHAYQAACPVTSSPSLTYGLAGDKEQLDAWFSIPHDLDTCSSGR